MIGFWGWIIPGWLKRAAAWLAGAALALLAAFSFGKREAKRDAAAKGAEEHIKTEGKVRDAIEDSRRSGADWHERLRKSDKR